MHHEAQDLPGQKRQLLAALSALLLVGTCAVISGVGQEDEAVSVEPRELPTSPTNLTVTASSRFDSAAVEAAKSKLLQEPKIKDLTFDPNPHAVEWQVGVWDDGSSRVGYAGYVCLKLAEWELSDELTDVRVVDLARVRAGEDFRSASLGHVMCSTGEAIKP